MTNLTPLQRVLMKIEAYEQTRNEEYLREIKAMIQSIDERIEYGEA